jgi:cytochrome c
VGDSLRRHHRRRGVGDVKLGNERETIRMDRALQALACLALTLTAASAAQAAKASAAGNAAHGKAVFEQQCVACHSVAPAAGPGAGPMLRGVVGRKAGAGDKGFTYSDALKKAGLTWTQANLGKFLTNQ